MSSLNKAAHPHLKLINEIHTLFLDNMTCVGNWGFYMFSPEFDTEPELRNRIGAIWLCSLLDSLEAEQRAISKLENRAADVGEEHLIKRCHDAASLMESVKEVMALYDLREQLFLTDYRNQLVHSWIARRHGQVTTVKYFDGNGFVREQLTPQELADRIRPFYEAGPLHPTLERLLSRFRDLHLRYWHVVSELRTPGLMDHVYDAMFEGEEFSIRSLREPVTGAAVVTISPPREHFGSSGA
jgi:hypothetical protein